MMESPNPNYSLEVRDLVGENWDAPDLLRFIDGGWLLTANHCVSITFLPYLPTSPWPPPIPDDFDSAPDRDGAMRVLLATSSIVVTPTDGPERIEDLVSHIAELQTVFWVSHERYARLDAELARLKRLPRVPRVDPPRLHALPDSDLKRFLRSDLPRAALSDYDRKILCVRARHAPGFELDSAISELYAVFAKYPAPTGVTHSPYAITDADVKRERVAP